MSGQSVDDANREYITKTIGLREVNIPTHWSMEDVSDIFNIQKKSFDPSNVSEQSTVQLYSMPAYDENNEPLETVAGEVGSKKYIVPNNTILFPKLNIFLKRFWRVKHEHESPAICSTEYWPLVPKNDLSLDYYYYFFNSNLFMSNPKVSLASGTDSHRRVREGSFERAQLPVPPLSEQRRIADILSTVDKQIQQTDEIIEKTKDLKQGLRQDILVQGLGEHTYTSINIGPLEYTIPETWDVRPIPRVAEINPTSANLENYECTFEYIDIDSVNPGRISGSKTTRIEEAPSRAKRKVSTGQILVSTVRPYLRAFAPVTEEYDRAVCSSGFAVLDAKERYDNQFLLQVVLGDYFLKQMKIRQTGTSYPAVNKADFETVQILCPPLEEQRRIGTVLSAVDDKLELEREQKQHLQDLKRGLMQDLLTGKVRVSTD